MRVSSLSFFALAAIAPTAVLGKTTHLKTNTGEYFGAVHSQYRSLTGTFVKNISDASALSINNKTELVVDGFYHFSLDREDGDNLTSIGWGFMYPQTPPTPGFSWAQNGSLVLDDNDFHGWAACHDDVVGRALFWASIPMKILPDGCEAISFTKVESN